MTSTVKVNNIQASDGGNIINQCGTTITVGASGDTVSLASGASQSGFGRSGTVDWVTTPKTSTFTAVSGEGYFINSGSAITVNLPAGSAGDIVSVSDYARNFATYNCKLSPNGSEKIGGTADDMILDVNGQATTLVYVDSTKGWINIQNAEDTQTGVTPAFIAATGGTITTVCTNYKVHTFTGPGTFCVSNAGNAYGSNTVSYMVVAGGGEGGSTSPSNGGGGGGAGGFRESKSPFCSYTASPTASTCGLAVTGAIPITVGAGGAQQSNPGNNKGNPGSSSIFSSITSAGGGGGKHDSPPSNPTTAGDGGSGGGGAASASPNAPARNPGGTGNEPPVSPPQGNTGGNGGPNGDGTHGGGGGGGATAVGGNVNPGTAAGAGGAGATTHISASPVAYAGGGGAGATGGGAPARGAASPCGTGGQGGSSSCLSGAAGTTNRGGGGGSAGWPAGCTTTGAGGSGIVIIRYKFQ
tara:strand:+ start:89 stop:1495 length:1407 start_codon:yes stop_codon:yes gene_type:complete